jgi:iron-sulfur cluster assembly protein
METLVQQYPVELTESAVAELKKLLEQEPQGKKLRVGVKGGGCSGMTYILEFADQQPEDVVFEIDGVPCIMNPAHEMYLFGMTVNWEGGLNSRGFTFINPNASKTCGCGTSFSV